ncbi:MAG: carnitine dehydratase [Microbacterium sp. 67-17]|uniref:CaiB/BaiF CoA transferase family protein n=1 Tax=Microbacterium sp. 67-17 TaxID=1895782 RepID=UPI00095CDDB6|nr:CoA transferase [Microbacterium sp. 67-17]OJW02528.1 MAG: carnitine dehydratase [Microbacterium sp. 67-17]
MADSYPGPLAGIRVLDFTQFLAGPHGTQVLGDLGADIIKIEAPVGDSSRIVPPHYVRGDSLYFHTINRNKRSVAVDMKAAGAVEVLRELIDKSDVVVENFRPGVLARLGIDREIERARRPELVWCSISGFGQDGPGAGLPAYDMIVQALSGTMSLTGEPGGSPVRTGNPIGDIAAGLHAVIGIEAALLRRKATGLGDFVDISMLDCLIALLSYQGTYYLQSGVIPGPQGARHDAIPTYRLFAARNGTSLVTTANTERMWQSMAKVLGLEELIEDERFLTNPDRLRNKEALWGYLEPAFLAREAVEWVELFNENGIPVATVNNLEQALTHPQVLHREMVIQLEGEGESVRTLGNPVKLQDSARTENSFPQAVGAAGPEVLAEVLGYDAERIAQLIAAGVIATEKKAPIRA